MAKDFSGSSRWLSWKIEPLTSTAIHYLETLSKADASLGLDVVITFVSYILRHGLSVIKYIGHGVVKLSFYRIVKELLSHPCW